MNFDPHSATPNLSAWRPAPPQVSNDWALFLDVDGCLLDHADTPALTAVPLNMAPRLCKLADELDGALALVSGRSIHMLDHLFPQCAQVAMSGLHGLERRGVGEAASAAAPSEAIERLTRTAQAICRDHPGAFIEAHGPCLNLHWRAAPGAQTALSDFAEAALSELADHRLHRGAHGIEIRPASSNKSQAINELMASAPFRGRRPVFAGDDVADESGFAVVNAHDGISVLVGDRELSAARYALPDPSAVRRWLQIPGTE
jgi:trehalose 6-phosphate phosphatase